ncbi:MAG: hypothetical protein QM770_09450 [Tepidisphaeraceae bacterium]
MKVLKSVRRDKSSLVCRAVAQTVEARRLLAVVAGTAGDDVISIDIVGPSIVVTVNGTPTNFDDAVESSVLINAGSGADAVTVLHTGLNTITVNGGAGNDTLTVGNGNFDVNVDANVTFNGNADTDLLRIDDTFDAPGDDVANIGAGTIKKVSGETVTWATNSELVESIEVLLGANADTINVNGSAALTSTTINAGDGNDSVIVGQDFDSNIRGNVSLNGAAGTNSLYIDDRVDLGADTYTFGTGTFTKDSAAGVTLAYASFASMLVDAGVNILSASPIADVIAQKFVVLDLETSTTVNAAGGDDTLNIGDGVADLELLDSPLNFNAGSGTDSIVVNDSNNAVVNDAYTIAPGAIALTGTATTTYASAESVTINAGSAANVIGINATAAATPVTINAGGGNDTINVGSGDLDANLLAAVSVNGGFGTDSLNLNDTLDDVGGDVYDYYGLRLEKNGTVVRWAGFGNETVEQTRVNGSPIASTYNLRATLATVTLASFVGGVGNDTFIVIPTGDLSLNLLGPISLDGGQAGTDAVIVNDTSATAAGTYTFGSNNVLTKTGLAGTVTTNASNETLLLDLPAGNIVQTVNVNALSGLDLTVNTGDGNDTIGFGGNNWASTIDAGDVTINAGAGTDSLTVNDASDSLDNGQTYTLGAATLTKSDTGGDDLTFNGLEKLVANTSGFADAINVMSVPATLAVTVNSGNGDDSLDASTTNDLDDTIVGPLVWNAAAGSDRLDLDDSSDAPIDADAYALSGLTFTKTGFTSLTFSSVDRMNLIGNGGANAITLGAFAAGQAITVSGGAGNDTISAGNGDLDLNLPGINFTLRGGADVDELDLLDAADDAGNDTLALSSTAIAKGAVTQLSYSEFEASHIVGSGQPTQYVVTDLTTPTTVIAGSANDTLQAGDGIGATIASPLQLESQGGNDTFLVGAGDLDEITGALTALGQGGIDSITIDDSTDTGDDTYELGATSIAKPGNSEAGIAVTTDALESTLLRANDGANTIRTTAATPNTTLLGNGGADTFDIEAGSPMIRGGAGLDIVNVNDDLSGTASATLDQSEDLGTYAIFAGGAINVASGGTNTLVVDGEITIHDGTLDLADNAMILRMPGDGSFIATRLAAAYADGNWTGSGAVITSSVAGTSAASDALGYAFRIDLGNPVTFRGTPLMGNELIVAYATSGDANLDGIVNFPDLLTLAANYGSTVARWSQGDFNYDGVVNFSDLLLLAQSYASVAPAVAASTNPGPAAPQSVEQTVMGSVSEDILA